MENASDSRDHSVNPPSRATFQSTHWSVVAAAGGGANTEAALALEQLCQAYWYPLYAYVRRQGVEANSAADVTQGFFAELFRRNDLKLASPQRGRFRSFLLTAMKNFMANQWDRQQAQKRGGGVRTWSLDRDFANRQFQAQNMGSQAPEAAFQREWAIALLDQARKAVHRQYERARKSDLYNALHGFLTGDPPLDSYEQLASALNSTPGAVKVAVHRLRQRFHDQIRAEIAQTVVNPDEIDSEIQELFSAFRSE